MPGRTMLKRLAARLPARLQNEMKRFQFAREMKRGIFRTDELEFSMLPGWLSVGDWVIDVGANIGHYTAEFSRLVGSSGRVIAFEPVPLTFELLSANVARLPESNVTLINAAASNKSGVVGMQVPKFDTGLDNYYMAHLSDDSDGLQIMTLSIDNLDVRSPVRLVKIDAEGHELSVLIGMATLIARDRPILIVEDNSPELKDYLDDFGYESRREPGSSNRIFEQRANLVEE